MACVGGELRTTLGTGCLDGSKSLAIPKDDASATNLKSRLAANLSEGSWADSPNGVPQSTSTSA